MKHGRNKGIFGKIFLSVVLVPTLFVAAISYRVGAEDTGLCFMVTSSGKTVSLGKLCGKTAQKPETNTAAITTEAPENKEHKSSGLKSNKKIDTRVARIPIKRRIGRTPVIEVNFNNKQSFDMILDTGANSTLITRKMANKLNIKTTGSIAAQIADGSQIKLLTGQVKSIAVSGMVAQNLEVAIAPNAGIGLLGHDFFGEYDIKLSAKEVEFHRR
ncbi:retroviral-like aspartic protease family protein [Richelia sinica FACHB-800]|nr:retroviral-like aspartic protease family protein [Richelia sinica FACHB-800]